jgi:hypothetical protein
MSKISIAAQSNKKKNIAIDAMTNYGNFKKHVERKHKLQYKEKFDELEEKEKFKNAQMVTSSVAPIQAKLASVSVEQNEYDRSHPKQVALFNSVTKNLILSCGVPFSIVEEDGFIEFQKGIDGKLARIHRREITEVKIQKMVLTRL